MLLVIWLHTLKRVLSFLLEIMRFHVETLEHLYWQLKSWLLNMINWVFVEWFFLLFCIPNYSNQQYLRGFQSLAFPWKSSQYSVQSFLILFWIHETFVSIQSYSREFHVSSWVLSWVVGEKYLLLFFKLAAWLLNCLLCEKESQVCFLSVNVVFNVLEIIRVIFKCW